MKGILFFHSETGTEGGYWAFQDELYMNLPPVQEGKQGMYHCPRCGRCWDKDRDTDEPKPTFYYLRPSYEIMLDEHTRSDEWYSDDATALDPTKKNRWSTRMYYKPMTFPLSPPPSEKFTELFNTESNENALECYEKGHERWDSPWDQHPKGLWSYDGLHVLRNGYKLKVFDPTDGHVVWDGVINLREHELFTETAGGMWIHADQEGEDREAWARMFFEEFPAELEQ